MTMKELPGLITAASNFVETVKNPDRFHETTSYSIANMVLRKLRALFVDHSKNSALEIVKFLKTSISHTGTTTIIPWQVRFSCLLLHSYDENDKKRAWKARSEGGQRRIIRTVPTVFSESDPAQPKALLIKKGTNPTLSTTRKENRRCLGDDIDKNMSL